jgi:hypothetical protein
MWGLNVEANTLSPNFPRFGFKTQALSLSALAIQTRAAFVVLEKMVQNCHYTNYGIKTKRPKLFRVVGRWLNSPPDRLRLQSFLGSLDSL